jgi:hypothetical protein
LYVDLLLCDGCAISSVGEKSHRRERRKGSSQRRQPTGDLQLSVFGCVVLLRPFFATLASTSTLPLHRPQSQHWRAFWRAACNATLPPRSSQTATNGLLILKREPHGPSHMHTSTTLHPATATFPSPALLSSQRCGRHFWESPVLPRP